MRLITLLILLACSTCCFCQDLPRKYGHIHTKLFLSPTPNNSLVVAFGGSEGGNTFADEPTKEVRKDFLRRGFHFLAVGYFGGRGLPKNLERISLSAISDTIQNIGQKLGISYKKMLLVGASRGGELVLNLSCRFDFMGVVAIVPSNITIPSYMKKQTTSSWTFNDTEVPYYDIGEELVENEGWANAITQSLATLDQNHPGVIPIENINGFVLLTSGKEDKLWPSYEMCGKMIDRLNKKNFQFPFEHIAFNDGHDATSHWPRIFSFLDQQLHEK